MAVLFNIDAERSMVKGGEDKGLVQGINMKDMEGKITDMVKGKGRI